MSLPATRSRCWRRLSEKYGTDLPPLAKHQDYVASSAGYLYLHYRTHVKSPGLGWYPTPSGVPKGAIVVLGVRQIRGFRKPSLFTENSLAIAHLRREVQQLRARLGMDKSERRYSKPSLWHARDDGCTCLTDRCKLYR